MAALGKYMQELLALPSPVSDADVLYTFLHTMPRDAHDAFARSNQVPFWGFFMRRVLEASV
jgi:hypothetical protein